MSPNLASRNKGSFGGAHVFPGGKIDFSDGLPDWKNLTDHSNIQNNSFNINSLDPQDISLLDFKICAIRETFEETGFLLSSPPPSGHIKNSSNLEFIDFIKNYNLTLLTSRLHYFSRWITPKQSPRRWDVQFFMLNISQSEHDRYLLSQIYPHLNPNNQQTMFPQTDELLYLDWRTPDKLYDAFCNDEISTITPQVYMLNQMQLFSKWQDLQKFAIYKDSVEGIKPFTSYLNLKPFPRIKIYTLPGDHLYNIQFKDDIDINGLGDNKKPLHRVLVSKSKTGKKIVQIVENVVNIPGIKFSSTPPNKL
ncbi:Nucleoside diphosphate-linked moiety X motif 19, mitochondrial [Smittium culicis]|uniref:Nucleoside diphosphate-linked moiety X motif 19, mitochondrial n=1 Tax=Smittium culicis TaxID=133412 RepID=A0A1R1YF20_9FUNG|nr:Nucleoside diphosphate-linked moiety X motif 19, mitochondrial [Smittium culicis]